MAIEVDPAGESSKSEPKKMTKEELLAKAYKPAEDAMKLHPYFTGKLETSPKCCIRDFDDFAIWYTPGVAEVCKDIYKHPEKVFEHTNKGNTVAVVTDGTRVLGLGDIGPEAGLAGNGREGHSVQIPGRRRCVPDMPEYQRSGGNHPDGGTPSAVLRRNKP